MNATADTRGLKRACACGTRFYDFNNRPILCPSCQAEFSGEIKLKTRRGRVAAIEAVVPEAAPRPVANDENIEEVKRDDNLISLEDVEEGGKDDEEEDMAIEGDGLEGLVEDIDEDLEEKEIEVKVEKE